MGEWSVKVFGPKHQIEAAVESLSSSDWAITQSGDEWYMRSSQHPVVGNGRSVADEAKREIDRINLAYGLFNPNDRALLTIGAAHSFTREDGTPGHFLQLTASIPIEIGLTTRQDVDGKEVLLVQWTPHAASATRMPYAVARRKLSDDPDLHAVAGSFLNRPDDWTRLAKVLELIEIRSGGQIPKAWVSRKKLKLLRRTANSFAEAGSTGRHARPDFGPPPNPMPIREAQQIARDILSKWLRSA
jgi:hypothetical protein